MQSCHVFVLLYYIIIIYYYNTVNIIVLCAYNINSYNYASSTFLYLVLYSIL